MSVVTIVGSILSFPLLPSDLLGRFLLMIVVPTTIGFSYGISKLWNLDNRDLKLVALALVGISLIFFVGQSFRTIQIINPSISEVGYDDLVNMKSNFPSDSVILTIRGAGLGYWVEYVEDVDLLGIPELSPELWQSYSHVFGIFPVGQVPPIPHKSLFVGSVYVLLEYYQPPSQPRTPR